MCLFQPCSMIEQPSRSIDDQGNIAADLLARI